MTAAELWPIVAATGHRPQHLHRHQQTWARTELARTINRLKQHHGTHTAITGMALGVDTWWAQAALDAGLNLWAYVPYPQQAARWQPEQRDTWKTILDRAECVQYFAGRYNIGSLFARNTAMVSDAHAVVAVWRPTHLRGGTWHATNEALQLGRPILHHDPDTQTVARLTTMPTLEEAR